MERLFVLGCHGLLGQNLVRLAVQHQPVIGVDLQPVTFLDYPGFEYRPGDLTDSSLVDIIREEQPEQIVNCAAWTAVDLAESEREQCWRVNYEGVRNVISGAQLAGARLVHISTDYVFDGTAGPYREDAVPNPQSVYARSKLAGENLLRGSNLAHCIIRTIVLFGKGVDVQRDFVAWLLQELQEGREVNIVHDQVGNVTYAPLLARAILQALRLRLDGILHVGSQDCLSRLEFAQLVARVYNLDQQLVKPISTEALGQQAARPLQGGLQVADSELRLEMVFDTIASSLAAYKEENPHTHRLN
ncbi:MAG: SDR family oxidoreductase [Candidatus Delongbacteria bacterium]|nr:SDR family oxidoreductase [Candidatus Delongbacteria bacterium]